MDVLEAIRGRRTVHEFASDPVTREELEEILAAAIWAPNHRLTNPWEFYVASGAAKAELAKLRGMLKQSRHPQPDSPEAQAAGAKAAQGLMTVPYAVLVCQRLDADPVRREEDLLAVACAIQNLMLAAYRHGIGTYWGTGPLIHHPQTMALLGVPEGRRSVGLIFLGRPAREQKVPAREPLAAHVRWVSEVPQVER